MKIQSNSASPKASTCSTDKALIIAFGASGAIGQIDRHHHPGKDLQHCFMIDQQLLSFIDLQAQGNRSDYLNSLLRQEQQRTPKTELITALQEDLQDPEYLAEIAEWDQLALDGINA